MEGCSEAIKFINYRLSIEWMITSIQLRENVKNQLEKFKETGKESYEEVIISLIHKVNEQKMKQKALLIEQCKAMYEDDIKVTKEWEATDASLNWEWK